MKKYKTVRDLLSNKARWTRHAAGRNKKNQPVDVKNKECVKFCLLGAIIRVYNYPMRKKMVNKLNNALNQFNPNYYPLLDEWGNQANIATFNDSKNRKHEEILSILKKANI